MMVRMNRRLKLFLLLGGGALLAILVAYGVRRMPDQVYFEDATLGSGIQYRGMTFGAAWSDFDGDGWPDLYLPNHGNPGMLYRNLGGGRFTDVTADHIDLRHLLGDEHGAAWADFDNDGDQDLVVMHGGGRGVGVGPNRLYRNDGVDEPFVEVAAALGVDNPQARGRMPLWLDADLDGQLDLFLGAVGRNDRQAPAALFLQREGRFVEAPGAANWAADSVPFCIQGLFDPAAAPELICRVQGAKGRTGHTLSTGTLPFVERERLPVSHFDDLASGDFDGDGTMDLYLARKAPDGRVVVGHNGVSEITADFRIVAADLGQQSAFRFKSEGELSFRVVPEYPPDSLTPAQVRIGAAGLAPDDLEFRLSPQSAGIAGFPAVGQEESVGLLIGFTPPDQWQLAFRSSEAQIKGSDERNHQVPLRIRATAPITDLTELPKPDSPPYAPDRLLINHDGALHSEGEDRGLDPDEWASQNVVVADFDNDMDLDIYVVASSSVANRPNLLYLNDGTGHFNAIPGAGGAPGGVTGIGDAVAVADFDRDGFLDLLVAEGGSMGRSYGLAAKEGGYRLYRNRGNGNHWLQIDLEGQASNRDGLGARVELVTGGRRQWRFQDGGVHNRAQNHSRLHFGLGDNPRVGRLRVTWPSGVVQELSDLDADQVIRVREP